MSDTSNADETNDDTNGGEDGINIKGLRDAARKGKIALDENEQLKRENLFLRAGIDTSSTLGQMLLKTFEGDDIEALKAKALEIGLLKAPEPTKEETDADATRQEEDDRRSAAQQNAGGGASTTKPNEGPDPRHTALEEYQRDIKAGVDPEEARENAFAKVISAGAQGDKRLMFDAEAHQRAGVEADRIASGRRSG